MMNFRDERTNVIRHRPVYRDWRVRELMAALNERILPEELVREKVAMIMGSHIHLYRYRDGSYFICDEV